MPKMTTIDLKDCRAVELWPGRRILLKNRRDQSEQLIKLPSGVMRRERATDTRSYVAFGGLQATTVIINGTHEQCDDLFTNLIEFERPSNRVSLAS